MRVFLLGLLVAVIVAGGSALYLTQHSNHTEAPSSLEMQTPVPFTSAVPSIRYPVVPESELPKTEAKYQQPEPVPPIDESDPSIEKALKTLFGEKRLEALFKFKDIVRRIVVTLDTSLGPNLPPAELSLVLPLESEFRPTEDFKERVLGPKNYVRYSSYVALVQNTEPRKVVALYRHFYPLFQSAYSDLGTPGYFNDRLISVIDNLLATPDVQGPIKVKQPSSRSKYKYVDEQLEALSAAQKLLLRMGPKNMTQIKGRLREYRELLTRLGK